MAVNMNDERIKAAQEALLNRRPARADKAAPSDMLEIKRTIRAEIALARDELSAELTQIANDALEEVRRVEVVVKQPNKVDKVLAGTHHHLFPTLVKASGLRDPIFLSGPAGGGKSTAGKMLADLLDLPFSYTGQTNMPHKVEGNRDPLDKTFYRHTPFTETFINGGVHMLEELDAWNPNASLVINAPLANRWLTTEDGKQYEQHPDAIFIACANTWGAGATAEYVGRNKLDAAFLDRFGIRLHWGYDPELEIKACGSTEVARSVQMARYNAQRYGIKIVISPRSSIMIAKMVRAGFTMAEAFDMNFLAAVDSNTKKKLMEDVELG